MRLAIVVSHPIQYYSPWFRVIAQLDNISLRVFYLWDSGIVETKDKSFGKTFSWDIPLLDGYEFEFIPNVSRDRGTHHFSGLDNPEASRRIQEWKADAILVFGYAWKTHLRVLFSRRLRLVPKLFRGDSHDLCKQAEVRSRISRVLKLQIMRRFSHFLPVGKASREYLEALGVAPSRITMVPHCVDNARFRASCEETQSTALEMKVEWGIEAGRPLILFVGKWEPKKRPLDLLEAYLKASFPDEARNPALVFVGDGALKVDLLRRTAERNDRDVFFVPFQNQSAMPQVYAAGDVLVLPSQGRGETWGLVVNEAMNLGTPAIVSSHVGCGPDLVIPGETGWQFEAGNIDALRSCLEEAMKDPKRLDELGLQAREHVNKYSYAVAALQLQKALEVVRSK